MTRFVFVTGGVVSSVGKGIAVASLGRILKSRGVSVSVLKLDPYLNVDPGTMSPYQHGEVFVTTDGSETDLDLGHYERFIDVDLTSSSNLTAGHIYSEVIARERKGEFLGRTIQAVPHVTDAIKRQMHELAEESGAEVIVVEVGGTVGDIEGLPFPRGHSPDAKRGRQGQRLLRPRDLPPLYILDRRAQDQAHAAQRPRAAEHRDPARRHPVPERPRRARRDIREDRRPLRRSRPGRDSAADRILRLRGAVDTGGAGPRGT